MTPEDSIVYEKACVLKSKGYFPELTVNQLFDLLLEAELKKDEKNTLLSEKITI